MCAGVLTLLQNNRHQGCGVGGPSGVFGAPVEGIERGLVNFDAGMGGLARAEVVETPEIVRKLYGSKAKRRGRWTRRNL